MAQPTGKHCAFIINVENAGNGPTWTKKVRRFTKADDANIKNTLELFNFDVDIRKTRSKKLLETEIQAVGDGDYWAYDSFLMLISGYGINGVLIIDGGTVDVADMVQRSLRSCESLRGKVKVVMIQCCDHMKYPFKTPPEEFDGEEDHDHEPVKMPDITDFYYAKCIIPGNATFRDPSVLGSVFVDFFCQEFLKCNVGESVEIEQVFRGVGRNIDQTLEKEEPELYKKAGKVPLLKEKTTIRELRWTRAK